MKTAATIATFAVAAFAGTTLADTINARFNGVSPGQSVTMRLDGHNINTQAGVFNFTRTPGNPGTLPGFSPTFQGFCIDLTEFVQVGHTYTWNTVALASAPTSEAGPMGANDALRLGRLFANQYNGLATASNQAQAYAAFQIAVWEIVFDSGLDVYNGDLKCTNAPSGTRSLAQSWLDTLGTGQGWSLIAIDNPPDCDGQQGYVLVPAPGAAALMAVGGLAGVRRRRR